MTFKPNRLQQIRISRNHSTRKAGRKAGLSQNTIINIEQGKSSPNLRTLSKLSIYYGLPIHELIKVVEDIKNDQKMKVG